ncbi:MAG: hypothetical protein DRP84_07330 [Spirochaetes bacterium]|nr:MAG: hypothetical protein DRP84_07330 [Spirochaetota bacterium]
MEITLTIAGFIILGSLICEFIDSAFGMLYGTILSPVLIIVGFEPLLVVPSILFSQAIGGSTASIFHHRLKNVDFSLKSVDPSYIRTRLAQLGYKESFNRGTTKDLKVSICVVCFGVMATIVSSLIAVNIPKVVLKTYIGMLVLIMGIILLSKAKFNFSWRKIIAVGILSAFNKGISGGGFGPVVTSGQIISGRDGKGSIGTTALTEVPICVTGFLVYLLTKGIPNWNLLLLLTGGAVIGAMIGPYFTARFKSEKRLKIILEVLTVGLGIWTLTKSWLI